MITVSEDVVQIDIEENDLIEAVATVKDLLEYLEDTEINETQQRLIRDLTTASETMEAFWCEHFGDTEHFGGEETDDEGRREDQKGQGASA